MSELHWVRDPDGVGKWATENGGSSAATELMMLNGTVTLTNLDPNTSDGAVFRASDFTIAEQIGTDLSLVDVYPGVSNPPNSATILSAAGGQFRGALFISLVILNLDSGDTSQRWLGEFSSSGSTVYNLGTDQQIPVLPGQYAQTIPFDGINIGAADAVFGRLIFQPIVGVAADSVQIDATVVVWNV